MIPKDGNKRMGSVQEPESYPVYLLSYLPITSFCMIYCPGNILKSTKGVEIKLSL